MTSPLRSASAARFECRLFQMITDELRHLAETVAQWADKFPGLRAIYLFGSRVRGDHRADSDIDLCIVPDGLADSNETASWWTRQNRGFIGGLKSELRAAGVFGRLEVHSAHFEEVTAPIRRGEAECVLTVRKVRCVLLPPGARPGDGS
jgi:hypothetical protein